MMTQVLLINHDKFRIKQKNHPFLVFLIANGLDFTFYDNTNSFQYVTV